jgi:hypothetical protein
MYSGLLRRVDWQKFTYVSKVLVASIIKAIAVLIFDDNLPSTFLMKMTEISLTFLMFKITKEYS